MASIDFQNGLLCGLFINGLSLGGNSGDEELPDGKILTVVNCDYYRGDWGHCVAYLNPDTFERVLSSGVYYAPDSGIVVIGSFQLQDWDDWSDTRPEAILKITADGAVIYEGDIYEYFKVSHSQTLEISKAFSYKSSFSIEAKRTNLTDSMALELYQTCIIGLNEGVK